MSLPDALLVAGRGPCSLEPCICRRTCSSHLTFAFTFDICKIACREGTTCPIFCPPLACSLFFTIHVIHSALANQLHNHLSRKLGCLPSPTLKLFFLLSPSSLFLSLRSSLPSTTMLVRAADSFPFPSPQAYPQGGL